MNVCMFFLKLKIIYFMILANILVWVFEEEVLVVLLVLINLSCFALKAVITDIHYNTYKWQLHIVGLVNEYSGIVNKRQKNSVVQSSVLH